MFSCSCFVYSASSARSFSLRRRSAREEEELWPCCREEKGGETEGLVSLPLPWPLPPPLPLLVLTGSGSSAEEAVAAVLPEVAGRVVGGEAEDASLGVCGGALDARDRGGLLAVLSCGSVGRGLR